MTSLLKLAWDFVLKLCGSTPHKRARKKARKEVKRAKKAGGMDAVRDRSSSWFRRNR